MELADDKAFLGRGWGFPVETSSDGEVALAAHEEDVREAVLLILGTEPGERVMRPDFGGGLRRFLFEPITATTRALVEHQVREALARFEPRIDVVSVRVASPPGAPEELAVELEYRVRATNTFYNLVYPFYLLEGRSE
jgi:phage baseplate assembly protein W